MTGQLSNSAHVCLQWTVIRGRGDSASASFHYALALRFMRQRAAADCGVRRTGVVT